MAVVLAQSNYDEVALDVRDRRATINHQSIKGYFRIPGVINLTSPWIDLLQFREPPFISTYVRLSDCNTSGRFVRDEMGPLMPFLTAADAYVLYVALLDLSNSVYVQFHGHIRPPPAVETLIPFHPRPLDTPAPMVKIDLHTGHMRMDSLRDSRFWLHARLPIHTKRMQRAPKRKEIEE